MSKNSTVRAKRPTEVDQEFNPHWTLNLEVEWPGTVTVKKGGKKRKGP